MLELAASVLEVVLLLLIVAGVYLLAGVGAALICAGFLGLAYLFIDRRGGL